MPLAREGRAARRHAADLERRRRDLLALMSGGRVPAMINFSAGAANVLARLPRPPRSTPFSPRTPSLKKPGSKSSIAAIEKDVRIVYLEDIRKTVTTSDKLRGALRARRPLVARKPDDCGGDPVHLGHGRNAQRRGAVPPQHAVQRRPGRRPHRFRPRGQLFNALPMFHSSASRAALCCR